MLVRAECVSNAVLPSSKQAKGFKVEEQSHLGSTWSDRLRRGEPVGGKDKPVVNSTAFSPLISSLFRPGLVILA
jgi:hypothetical protein